MSYAPPLARSPRLPFRIFSVADSRIFFFRALNLCADPKVLHNVAIAEYVQGGCRDARKLLSALEALKQRLEDARAEAEFGEGDALGDMDPSLTAYNMAVLLYQLKQYARCRTILEDMFSNIEPIDEFLAFKLCFLLLDVYLLQKQAERAAEVLAYLEKSFLILTKAEGKENGVGDGDSAAAAGGDGNGGSPGSPKVDGGGGDWPNKRSARRPPTTISAEEVRGALALYKAKLALMSKASKSSKREIKTTLNACAPNTTGLFLKCNLEWQRQNFRKAIKLLNNSCQTKGERDANVPARFMRWPIGAADDKFLDVKNAVWIGQRLPKVGAANQCTNVSITTVDGVKIMHGCCNAEVKSGALFGDRVGFDIDNEGFKSCNVCGVVQTKTAINYAHAVGKITVDSAQ